MSGQRRAVDPKTGRLYRILGPARAVPRSFGAPPPALRTAHLDNLAIVPASLLPEKAEWQALANALPAGSTLIVLPGKPGAARAALERVSRSLAAHGSRVTTIEQHERQPRRTCRETVAPGPSGAPMMAPRPALIRTGSTISPSRRRRRIT